MRYADSRLSAVERGATRVYRRGGRGRPGEVVGYRRCRLEGCLGVRIITRWPDGHRTEPCSRGMRLRKDKQWQID